MKRFMLLVASGSMAAMLVAPPAQANGGGGPCPQDCRPMDCELIYAEGDLANGVGPTLEWKCYN